MAYPWQHWGQVTQWTLERCMSNNFQAFSRRIVSHEVLGRRRRNDWIWEILKDNYEIVKKFYFSIFKVRNISEDTVMHIRRQGQGGVDPGQCEVEPRGEEHVQGNLVVIVMIVKEGKTYLWKTLWEVVQWWNLHQCSPLPRSSSRWSGPGCCQLSDQPCFPIRSKYRRNFIHFKPIQFEQVKEIVSESPFPLDWTWPPCLHKAQLFPPLQSYKSSQFIFWSTQTWIFPSVRQKSRIYERLDDCSFVCHVFHHCQI